MDEVQAEHQQQQAVAGPGSSVPPVAAATPQDAAKQKRITNGTTFLNDARVKASPISRRVNFLKSKGLTADEIVECFQRAGQPQSLESIQSLISGAGAPPVPPPVAGVAAAAVPPQYATAPAPIYAQHPAGATPYQQQQQAMYGLQAPTGALPLPPPPPPLPPPRTDKWKDYVLGAGAVGVAALGAWKAFETFSPFELRRKRSTDALSSPSGSNSGRNQQQQQQQRYRQSSSSGNNNTFSSESETDILLRRRQQQQQQGMNAALPQPPAQQQQTPQVTTTMTSEATTAEKSKQLSELEEKVKSLETEVAETKAALDKERRERAELAVGNSKLKGQLQSLSRTSDKSAAEVVRLTNELATLRVEKEREDSKKLMAEAAAAPPASAAVGGEGTATTATTTAAAAAAEVVAGEIVKEPASAVGAAEATASTAVAVAPAASGDGAQPSS